MKKIFLALIIGSFLLTLLITESTGGELKPVSRSSLGWLTVYNGILPQESLDSPIATLSNSKGIDAIVFRCGDSLELIAFYGINDWGRIGSIQIKDDDRFRWGTGSIFNNGNEQLICSTNTTVTIYDFDDKLHEYTITMPYPVDDLEIGDIDNDGMSELVALCIGKRTSSSSGKYHVIITKIDEHRIKNIWDDSTKLNLGYHVSMPKDKIMCIADIYNAGTNELVILASQSDVSPSQYMTFQWINNSLKETEGFSFEFETIEVDSNPTDYFLIGRISAHKFDRTVFLGSLVGPLITGDTFILTIKDSELSILEKCFDGWMKGYSTWANLDGKGYGVLRVWKDSGYPSVRYHYYRPST